jgi:ankyrin repeat protein
MCFVLLTSHGADPNATNKRKWTPLHYAALYGSLSTVKTLIQYGARGRFQNTRAGRGDASLTF